MDLCCTLLHSFHAITFSTGCVLSTPSFVCPTLRSTVFRVLHVWWWMVWCEVSLPTLLVHVL